MAWSLALPDWEDRLRDGRSLVPPLPLDQAQAERAVAVFNKLRLADVAGNPTLAEASGEWFRDIIRALFGSYDRTTGIRHIRELFCLVPKKNSKTTYGGLMMLPALLLNLRPRAKFICTGPTQDITDLSFSQVKGAIELDPVLSAKLHVREHLKKIQHRQTGAELEIMTFDPSVLTGQKPAGILIDELHVVAKMAKAASALRQLRGGMMATPEAFMAFITTQSEEAPAGVFRTELRRARAIRDGRMTGDMLPVLYEFPEAMQRDKSAWTDPKNWPMVTPNLGRSITIDRLVQGFQTAKDLSEDEVRVWASQHLNVEVGVALMTDALPGAEFWERQAEPVLTLESLLARCEVVCVGVDGGGLDDLLGLAVLGREKGTRNWLLWLRAWAHPIVLQRRKEEAPRLLDFAAEGDLRIVDRIGDDVDEVVETIATIDAAGLLSAVGLDPAGVGAIVDALAEKGIEGDRVVGISQGWRLNGAIKTFGRKLADGTLVHSDQPMAAWCVGNAKAEPKGNALTVTKQTSGSAKIDPLMAALNAVDLMSRNPAAADGGSYLSTSELAILT
jgi:phage terminase large subunit-like protein